MLELDSMFPMKSPGTVMQLNCEASISTTSTDQQCHRPNGPPTVNLAAKVNDNDNDNEFV